MPYSGPNDSTLPANIQALSEQERRKWVAVFNSTFQQAKKRNAPDETAEKIAFKFANGSVKAASEDSDPFIPMQTFLARLRVLLRESVDESDFNKAVAKARAHAGGKAKKSRLMATGEEFMSDEDSITPVNLDDKSLIFAFDESHGRMFLESVALSEAPEWMPLLPKPGSYKHPKWGQFSITKERNDRFIENFNKKVYQERLPIDAEHEYKLSGAVGWITALKQNSDGSVDAKVDWTDRGRTLIEADSYKYVSPEWWDKWTAPDTGKEYKDVVIGAAITTRPYFKEGSLRPLVASEFTEEQETEMPETTNKVEEEETTPHDSVKMTELQAELAEAKQAREAAEADSKQMKERISQLETDSRSKRFTDEVFGKSSENGLRWAGEAEKHVGLLMKLSEAFGDESDEVKDYVSQQRAIAEQLEKADQFKPVGAGGESSGNTAWDEMTAKANELVTAGTAKTFAEGIDKITSDPQHRDLIRRYENERK